MHCNKIFPGEQMLDYIRPVPSNVSEPTSLVIANVKTIKHQLEGRVKTGDKTKTPLAS